MNKLSIIATGILATTLMGCGGESGSTSGSATSTGIALDASLKGPASTPELATVTSGTVYLNSLIQSEIVQDGVERWTFASEADGDVLLALSSSAEDLDLAVDGNSVSEESTSDSSREWIIFRADSGESYQLEVESWYGDGPYELQVTTPNRESVGLSENEYLYEINAMVDSECDGSERSYTYSYNMIVNWTEGYIRTSDKTNFTSVDGTQVTITYSESENEPEYDYSYEMSGSVTFTVDLESGEVSGTDIWSDSEEEDGDVAECNYQEALSGRILL